MKFLLNFLYYRRRIIAVILAIAAVYLLFAVIYGTPIEAMIYPSVICAAVTLLAAVFDFVRFREKFTHLKLMEREILLSTDNLPECDSEVEETYQELIKALFEAKAELRTEADKRYDRASGYFTLWVHQIKTPISAMDLLLQNAAERDMGGGLSDFSLNFRENLQKIEQYAEMALLYVRLDSEDGDLVFRHYPLDSIIRKAARKFSAQFIGKRLSLNYEPLDIRVLTDERWLTFVIGQIISNSLKYTKHGGITIELEQPGEPDKPVLLIRDTGIGIAPEDLPRIFDCGFTGNNGRSEKRATGIGLYLCKRVCERLGCEISARSDCEPGQSFTEIRLDLSGSEIDTRE